MREYKFRVWDTENKEMLKVQELDFEDTFYGGRLSIRTDQYNDYFDIEDMILMQYTGLKDKNGKEIYEGDIIFDSFYERKAKVVFLEGAFWLDYIEDFKEYETIHKRYQLLANYDNKSVLEVIGNIYDNKKLLEEGEQR